MPAALGFDQAAAIPMSALTAWQVLFVHAGMRPEACASAGKRVLVTAAAVGRWWVGRAARGGAGAQVVRTCGARNVEYVRKLARSVEVLDYASINLEA
jgi:NADPH:quinone reductase-like Zn-dependent oxidoreductase